MKDKNARKSAGRKAASNNARRKPTAKLREGTEQKVARTKEILKRLKKTYPDAHCALIHGNPYQLLVATILSAQCTDARVNLVTPALFERYPAADDLAGAKPDELEETLAQLRVD